MRARTKGHAFLRKSFQTKKKKKSWWAKRWKDRIYENRNQMERRYFGGRLKLQGGAVLGNQSSKYGQGSGQFSGENGMNTWTDGLVDLEGPQYFF